MRSPPPIPRLRRDVALIAAADHACLVDRASGQRLILKGSDWERLWPLLVKAPPGQAELSKQLQLPRLRVQTMVAELLEHHAFLTPRAIEHAEIMRFQRAWRKARKPFHLHTSTWLGPRDAAGLRAGLRQLFWRRKGPLDALLAALGWLENTLAEREARFAPDEVFATRDAFHIVRPDPVEAPDVLHQRVDALGVAAVELAPAWRDAVHAVLSGVDGRQGAPLAKGIRDAWLHAEGPFRGVDAVRGFGMMFLMQRLTLHGVDPTNPAFVAWLRRHRELAGLLFMVSARVFAGRGAPPSQPSWWRS